MGLMISGCFTLCHSHAYLLSTHRTASTCMTCMTRSALWRATSWSRFVSPCAPFNSDEHPPMPTPAGESDRRVHAPQNRTVRVRVTPQSTTCPELKNQRTAHVIIEKRINRNNATHTTTKNESTQTTHHHDSHPASPTRHPSRRDPSLQHEPLLPHHLPQHGAQPHQRGGGPHATHTQRRRVHHELRAKMMIIYAVVSNVFIFAA